MINVTRGDSRDITFTLVDTNNDPIDITDYTLWFTVRTAIPATTVIDDTSAVISIEQSGISITEPLLGKTTFSLSPTMTDINPGSYIYDIQIKSETGRIRSTGIDDFIVFGDSTRDR